MPKFRAHKYTWQKPFTSIRHQWELIGPNGGVHFTANLSNEFDASCGLEFHHPFPPDDRSAPGHINCWRIGGRCWHDGTSLYASEHLWPLIQPYLRTGE